MGGGGEMPPLAQVWQSGIRDIRDVSEPSPQFGEFGWTPTLFLNASDEILNLTGLLPPHSHGSCKSPL